jgi:hypothetical protein
MTRRMMAWIEMGSVTFGTGGRQSGSSEATARRAAGGNCVTDSPVLFRRCRQLPIQLRLPRLLARVLDAPVPVDGRRNFIQPGLVGNVASEGFPRKFLHTITLRMAERFEQARPHEQRNVMRADAQRLGHLLLGHEDGKFFQRLYS